jgi:hypothetical protein
MESVGNIMVMLQKSESFATMMVAKNFHKLGVVARHTSRFNDLAGMLLSYYL